MKILGIDVQDNSLRDVEDALDRAVDRGQCLHLVTLNPEYLVRAQSDSEFMEVLNKADLTVVDGIGLVFASLVLFGKRLKRVTGVSLVETLCQYSAQHKYRVFLLGSTSEVMSKAVDNLKSANPTLEIEYSSGTANVGKESERERSKILRKINSFRPNLLFVAYGAPIQDLWIARNSDNLNINFSSGVGGSFDYISGNKARVNTFTRQLGLEWLVRLTTEPGYSVKRTFRAVVVFPLLVLRQRIIG